MKDFISKLTFGFLMAQFVPGVIVVSSIIFLYAAFSLNPPDSIKEIIRLAAPWFNSPGMKVLFVLLSVGSGMLIHGLHWAVLAYLETAFCGEGGSRREIHELKYHNMLIILQVILGPVIILVETFMFFVTGLSIEKVRTHENVPEISDSKMGAFNFLQDFYLYFAQFYAHTGYALLVLLISLCIFVSSSSFGYSNTRLILLVATYLLSGLFFVIGRIQLSTLFSAERKIV